MPAFLISVMNFVKAFGLADILGTAIGIGAILAVLWIPMRGSDQTDSYGGLNYALAVVMVAVFCVIAVPMIWIDRIGLFYSFCFCLIIGGLAMFRWHLMGDRQFFWIRENSESIFKEEASNGRKKS